MYSPMSMRTMAFSSSNRYSARARASSVLPTPVGPRNMNEPTGLFLPRADRVDRLLLTLPVLLHLGDLDVERGQLVLQRVEALERGVVGLLRQRHLLDLELEDPPLDDVDLGRQRVDLDAQLA